VADWTWMDGSARRSDAGDGDSVRSRVQDLGSVRGRAGIVVENTLLYATGGYAWGRASYSFVDTDAGTLRSRLNEQGLVYGAGAELQLVPGILLRAEYLRYSFGKDVFIADAIPAGPSSVALRLSDVDTIRVGMSFKFDREVRAVPLK
jgi:outer membrane immunogenic protein